LTRAADVCRHYRDLELGLADASIVVLADRWSTHAVATFDESDFRNVTALDGRSFDLYPGPERRPAR
jgi:predicted nucleic acid-binding protein